MLLFLDTETTGLPKKRQSAEIQPGIWPDIVSIAWIVTSDDGRILHTMYTLVRPCGWTIPEDSTRIHGITHAQAEEFGMDLQTVMERFCEQAKRVKCIVAHNMHFDKNVIIHALKWRLHMDVSSIFVNTFCTMQGRYIKLVELYTQLFGSPPSVELHNALHDATICMQIYFKRKNLLATHDIPTTDKNVPSKVSTQTLSLRLADA